MEEHNNKNEYKKLLKQAWQNREKPSGFQYFVLGFSVCTLLVQVLVSI